MVRILVGQSLATRSLLAEANQWPQEVSEYFGQGDEFHMAFHFPVMPRIYMALAQADATPIIDILTATPHIPEDCQWCTFLRNHDELTLEMVTPEEREYMWQTYAPEPRMRLNLGIRRRLAPLLDNDQHKIELLNALLFSLPLTFYGMLIRFCFQVLLPFRLHGCIDDYLDQFRQNVKSLLADPFQKFGG